jgi:prepilin-type N-terminal cleavage/methylation domain-containing protein
MESSSPTRGFTLIEIIMSITITLLLTGLFVANYNGFNNSQIVNQSTSDIITNLQAARTKATSGVKPSGCDTLVGYIVNFPTTGTYTTSALCLVGGSQSTVGDVQVYTLPKGVAFPSPTPGPITFYALDRGASVDQTISIVGNGVSKKVSVTRSGLVSDFIPTPTP